jgi:hypothetical protein
MAARMLPAPLSAQVVTTWVAACADEDAPARAAMLTQHAARKPLR